MWTKTTQKPVPTVFMRQTFSSYSMTDLTGNNRFKLKIQITTFPLVTDIVQTQIFGNRATIIKFSNQTFCRSQDFISTPPKMCL